MFPRRQLLTTAAGGLAATLLLNVAMAQTTVTVNASPTSRLHVAQFNREAFPAFAAFNGGSMEPLFVVLSNNSDKPLMTVVMEFQGTSTAGEQHAVVTACHSFLTHDAAPVVNARDSILVGPGMCIPQTAIGTSHTTGMGANKQHERLVAAAKVVITMDAGLFLDGELVGNDKWQRAVEGVARMTASRSVAAQVRSGASLDKIIADARAAQQNPGSDTRVAKWTAALVERLKVSRHFDSELEFLESRPVPPIIYRSAN